MPDFNEMYVDPSDSDADFGEINPPGSNITLTDYFRDDTALKFGSEEDQTMYFDCSLDNLVINHESGKISGSLLSVSNNEVEFFKFKANGAFNVRPVTSLPSEVAKGDVVVIDEGGEVKFYIGGE